MKVNINTLLIAITLAVMGWVGAKTAQNNREIGELSVTMEGFKELRVLESQQIIDIKDALKKLDTKLTDTVTRAEFQHRLESVERRLSQIEAKFKS